MYKSSTGSLAPPCVVPSQATVIPEILPLFRRIRSIPATRYLLTIIPVNYKSALAAADKSH
jgi:hypothetical protein